MARTSVTTQSTKPGSTLKQSTNPLLKQKTTKEREPSTSTNLQSKLTMGGKSRAVTEKDKAKEKNEAEVEGNSWPPFTFDGR